MVWPLIIGAGVLGLVGLGWVKSAFFGGTGTTNTSIGNQAASGASTVGQTATPASSQGFLGYVGSEVGEVGKQAGIGWGAGASSFLEQAGTGLGKGISGATGPIMFLIILAAFVFIVVKVM